MDNLKIFAIRDNASGTFSNLSVGIDEKDFCVFLTKELITIANELDSDKVSDFVDRVRGSSIYKLGEVSLESGAMISDLQLLVNLSSFVYKKEVDDNGLQGSENESDV